MKLFAICILLMLAATAVFAQTDAQKSFDQLKSLAGSWGREELAGRTGTSFLPDDRRRVCPDERNQRPRRGHDFHDSFRRT
jgi:hypothetical protein